MIPYQDQLFTDLWIAVICAQSCLLIVLAARRAVREYPAFAAFVGFCVVRSFSLLYVSHQQSELYQQIKWIAYVPQFAILIAVVLEVLYLLFHPFETLPAKTMLHFLQAAGTVALVAVLFAVLHPGAQPSAWMTFARAMDQAVSWVLCSVFILVALFAKYFGIPWRHRVYGIGFGFLLYLSADVAVTTIVAQYRLPPFSPVWLLDMLAFLAACAIWIYYFSAREVARSVPSCEQVQRLRAVLGSLGNLISEAKLENVRKP